MHRFIAEVIISFETNPRQGAHGPTTRCARRSSTRRAAFNMFRMAAILQGNLARSLQGNIMAGDSHATGERAACMAEAGWRQALQSA